MLFSVIEGDLSIFWGKTLCGRLWLWAAHCVDSKIGYMCFCIEMVSKDYRNTHIHCAGAANSINSNLQQCATLIGCVK